MRKEDEHETEREKGQKQGRKKSDIDKETDVPSEGSHGMFLFTVYINSSAVLYHFTQYSQTLQLDLDKLCFSDYEQTTSHLDTWYDFSLSLCFTVHQNSKVMQQCSFICRHFQKHDIEQNNQTEWCYSCSWLAYLH